MGYSFGSLFAHLVSSILASKSEQHHTVQSVILIDGPAPGPGKFNSSKLPVSSRTTVDYIEHLVEAAQRIEVQRSPAKKIIFVRSTDQEFFDGYANEKTTLGWKAVEPDLEAECIPGSSHLTIMAEPHVSQLGSIVSAEI